MAGYSQATLKLLWAYQNAIRYWYFTRRGDWESWLEEGMTLEKGGGECMLHYSKVLYMD